MPHLNQLRPRTMILSRGLRCSDSDCWQTGRGRVSFAGLCAESCVLMVKPFGKGILKSANIVYKISTNLKKTEMKCFQISGRSTCLPSYVEQLLAISSVLSNKLRETICFKLKVSYLKVKYYHSFTSLLHLNCSNIITSSPVLLGYL